MRAVAVGDSITRTGGAAVSPDLEPLSWSQRVAREAGWGLDTFAVSGAPTEAIVCLVPDAGDYDVALTCAGTNDVLSAHRWDVDEFGDHLAALLSRLVAIADRLVVLGLVPNVGRLPTLWPYGWGLAERVRNANVAVQAVGADYGALVVMPGPLRRPVEMFGDGVHPTSYGHALLACQVLAVLGHVNEPPLVTPSRAYLRFSRRRTVTDALRRPVRGIGSSLLAATR